MRNTKLFIIAVLFLIKVSNSFAQSLKYEGKEYIINGINIPWHSFGSDVGTHYQWGALNDSTWFENTFTDLENYGVNCARLWIHCDGRTSPEFTDSGVVSGLDANFFENFDDIFLRAEKHHIMLIPCLWSFDMTKDYRSTAGNYAGWHADLIRDTLKTKSYIDNALIPMVQHYANQCNLLAWEIINEPEWSMDIPGGGNTIQQVKANEMQRFVGMQAEAIHQYSNKMVTLGSASIKWNSNEITNQTSVVGNYWSDSALQVAYPHPLAYLDFYEIHYYDWMYAYHFDPFDLSYPLSFWKLDKPVIIGEAGTSTQYTSQQMLDNGSTNKYAGVLFWSYAANDGYGNWDDCKSELFSFSVVHHDSIYITTCDTASEIISNKQTDVDFKVYYSDNKIFIQYQHISLPAYWEIVNLAGQKIMNGEIKNNVGTKQIDVLNWSQGLYFIVMNFAPHCSLFSIHCSLN